MEKQVLYYRMIVSSLSDEQQQEEINDLKIAAEGQIRQQQPNSIVTLDVKNKIDNEKTETNFQVTNRQTVTALIMQHTTKTEWLYNVFGLFDSLLLGLGAP